MLAGAYRIGQKPIHSSLRGFCHDTDDVEEEFSPLNEEQLKQVYGGVYPTDFPREAIRLKTTLQQHSLLQTKFNRAESDRGEIKRLRFNRELSATSILNRITPVHDRLVEGTRNVFYDHFYAKNLVNRFIMYTNSTFYVGADTPDTIRLVPDLAICSASQHPFLVLEVGLNEKYDDMLETAKIVLSKSPTTKFCIIIKVFEKPLFRPPVKLGDFLCKPRSNIPIPSPLSMNDCHACESEPEGPIMVNGLRWVGKLSAFWEIWGRDISGNPAVIGERLWFYGPDAQSQTIKVDLTEPEGNSTEIVIKSSVLAKAIHDSRAHLAVNRCYEFLTNWSAKRQKT
ncbi:conserved hypothetical protein [Histoplasma capsulatum var. duboisii H88]|uniref:Uncharacterized protein n=2 Tax=Ajellomyces capsulatus (strain H88) TaxID=544711 RepID=F0UTP8_AJEC8|nr:conserved hypothetical protein [Histoplasma capsulatum var. duboisii H88]